MKGEKKKVLFYFEEAVDAWIPVPKETDGLIQEDNFEDVDDIQSLQFKIFMMTDEELKNLPVD